MKRNIDQIAETLVKCNGIKIVVMFSSFRRMRYVVDDVFKYFEYITERAIHCTRRADRWEMKLPNGSELIGLPFNENSLCGVRVHQVIIDAEVKMNDNIVQNIVLPITASVKHEIFLTGVFEYEEKTN